MKEKRVKIKFEGNYENERFENIVFEELVIRNSIFKNVLFEKIDFKNSYLGFNVEFENCQFYNCKFFGKYSSLGTHSKYENCTFSNCSIVGIDILQGTHFKDCTLSGKIENSILNDFQEKIPNNYTIFENCNLQDIVLKNISIYGKNVFRNTKLPRESIRIFENKDNQLYTFALKKIDKIKDLNVTGLKTIFRDTSILDHELLILDEYLINSIFTDKTERILFESIVKDFEVKISS